VVIIPIELHSGTAEKVLAPLLPPMPEFVALPLHGVSQRIAFRLDVVA
jgi:hypothetical protein